MDQLLGSLSFNLIIRCLLAGVFFTFSFLVARDSWDGIEFSKSRSEQTADWPWKGDNSNKKHSADFLTFLLPISLFSGLTIYGIHRSLIYPMFEFLFDFLKARGRKRSSACVCPLIFYVIISSGVSVSFGFTSGPSACCAFIGIFGFLFLAWKIWRGAPLISEGSLMRIGILWNKSAHPSEAPNNSKCTIPEPHNADRVRNWADFAHQQYTSAWCLLAGALIGSRGHGFGQNGDVWSRVLLGVILITAAVVSDWRLHGVIRYIYRSSFEGVGLVSLGGDKI